MLYLPNTSLSLTYDPLLVVGEMAICRVLISNIIGVQSDLTLLIEMENPNINIIDGEIVHIGYVMSSITFDYFHRIVQGWPHV